MSESHAYEVVIAAYNMAEVLGETITSLQQSTVPPQNIWVVDDASGDPTAEIARSFDGVSLLQNNENRERSYSRNRGIEHCTAPFVQIIDGDDLLHPCKVEIQLEALGEHAHWNACFGPRAAFADSFDLDSNYTTESYPPDGDLLEQIMERNIIIPGMLLFRRSFFTRFGTFDPEIKIAEDRELLIRSLIRGGTIGQTPEAITYYRRHPESSVVTGYREGVRNNYLMFKKLFDELCTAYDGQYRRQLSSSMRMMARNLNIYGFPRSMVNEAITMALKAHPEYTVTQNNFYHLLDRLFGPQMTETLLRREIVAPQIPARPLDGSLLLTQRLLHLLLASSHPQFADPDTKLEEQDQWDSEHQL